MTLALNALTLAVAGVALFTSLLTLSGLRLAQLAPLWAIGVTRRRLAAIEMAKTLALAALTALIALPVGLAVAWVLTDVINVAAFGWRLPIHVYPRTVGGAVRARYADRVPRGGLAGAAAAPGDAAHAASEVQQ